MKSLRTISRAILAVVMASSFLMMSFAAGIHELSHVQGGNRTGYGTGCPETFLHADGKGAIGGTIASGTALPLSAGGGDFCFFCTHTPSLVPVTAQAEGSCILISSDTPRPLVSAPITGDRLTRASPRAPPFIG